MRGPALADDDARGVDNGTRVHLAELDVSDDVVDRLEQSLGCADGSRVNGRPLDESR